VLVWSGSSDYGKFVLTVQAAAETSAPSFSGGKTTLRTLSWNLDRLVWHIVLLLLGASTVTAAMLFPILLAAAAGTAFACRRRYSRGQPLLPGIVKTAAHPPSVPRFGGGLSGFTSPGSEYGNDAPLVSAEVGMTLVAPGIVASPLLQEATPASRTGTCTDPTPHGSSAALTRNGLITPQMAGGHAAPERSAAVTVERLRARLAEARRVQGGD
jgi:hypothetical protein